MKKLLIVLALIPTIFLIVFFRQNLSLPNKETFRAQVIEQSETTYIFQALEGEYKDQNFESDKLLFASSEKYPLKSGDKVFASAFVSPSGEITFAIYEYDRSKTTFILLGLFVLVVIFIAKWTGFYSLISLAGSLSVILIYILPMLVRGYNPVLVSLSGGIGMMFFTIYLSHGFHKKTTIAFLGIIISLILTLGLSYIFTSLLHLSGYISEETVFLVNSAGYNFDIINLLIAGILIGAIGVLDDVCVSQSSLVHELRIANPRYSRAQIYKSAMRVGVDHVGSVVNTLALAYTASMLPLLLLFVVVSGENPTNYLEILNQELIVSELARILISSIGIVAAVPITTWLAVRAKN